MFFALALAEFILETNYSSRRIIRQTDNSSMYKSEDDFWRIICLGILRGLHDGNRKHCENIETSPSHVETSSEESLVPSRYKFRDGSSV